MDRKYQLNKAEVPEGGIARHVPGLGKVTINENTPDELIDRLPEELIKQFFVEKKNNLKK